MAPEQTVTLGGTTVQLIGTIAGFVPDAARVEAALTDAPACIAVGIPPEDLMALEKLAAEPELAEGLPDLDEWSARLFELLSKWGETKVPSPDLHQAHLAAMASDCALEAIDLDDSAHTDAHTRHLKLRHIVRMNTSRNRLLKKSFDSVQDPYELASAWDAIENGGKALQAIQHEREAHMASRLRELAAKHARIVAIVPATRLAGVAAQLQDA